jgi:elongation factor Ts
MNNPVELIKQLRRESGVGVMECRKALEQSGQDYPAALACLREHTASEAQKQAGRAAREGKIELYSHANGRIGVMVEINCETEYASRSEVFRKFGHEIALQITSAAPLFVSEEDIPPQVLEAEVQAAIEKARRAGKPEKILLQIAEGVAEKYKNQHVLLRQAYIRDETINVSQLLNQAIHAIGENIIIRRFARWEICPEEAAQA